MSSCGFTSAVRSFLCPLIEAGGGGGFMRFLRCGHVQHRQRQPQLKGTGFDTRVSTEIRPLHNAERGTTPRTKVVSVRLSEIKITNEKHFAGTNGNHDSTNMQYNSSVCIYIILHSMQALSLYCTAPVT